MKKPNPFAPSVTYSSFCEDVMHLGHTRAVMLADQSGVSGQQIAQWIAKFSGKRVAGVDSLPSERVPAPVPFQCA